jgi:transposase
LKEVVTSKGVKLEFLPPYSPDYNPIEYSFSVLKRQLKHKDYLSNLIEGDDEAFANAIIAAAKDAVTPEISRNQFRHCGFRL